MSSSIYDSRVQALQKEMTASVVDLVAISPSANNVYLTGFKPYGDERPCVLFITPASKAYVVPELNADQVEAHTDYKVIRWKDADGPQAAFEQALARLGVTQSTCLAVDNTMRADFLLLVHELTKPEKMIPANDLISSLRLCKSPEEVDLMKKAAMLADQAILAGVEACKPGVSEKDVADTISSYFRRNGADEVSFVLVASGPNGAFPHHEVSDRVLKAGDVVILDIGAMLNNYQSDITRVVSLGEPSDEVLKVYEIVRAANEAGRNAARAGALAKDVDMAARDVITKAGYGPNYLHRTGHGIGLEVHEGPWITSTSETVLKPGMAFSVEPGIYLQGRFGIRIEDIVVTTEGECNRLTGLPHDLYVKI